MCALLLSLYVIVLSFFLSRKEKHRRRLARIRATSLCINCHAVLHDTCNVTHHSNVHDPTKIYKLLPWTVDHLARGSMKNAVNCAS